MTNSTIDSIVGAIHFGDGVSKVFNIHIGADVTDDDWVEVVSVVVRSAIKVAREE